MSAPVHLIEETTSGFLVRSEPPLIDSEQSPAHDRALALARLRRLEFGGKVDDRTALAGKAVRR